MDANELKNTQPSKTNTLDHLPGPSVMNDSGTIECDCKSVVENFHEMNLKEELLRGIYEYGYEKPTAIQQRAILQCIKGHDVTIQAQSVSGKTTSVLISILQQINTSLSECQALILVPSFELARQIQNVVIALGKFMKADCHACTGVENIHDYIREVNTFPHVVVATPYCANDLIHRNLLRTQFIKIFVLDEANFSLYRSNKFQVQEVFKCLEEDTKVILLSNQMFKKALDQSTQFVSNPVRIFMQKEEQTLEAFKQFYNNNSQKNETQNPSDSNDYLLYSEPSSMDISGTIESNVVDNFHDMNLKDELLRGIYECGFKKPSAFQHRTILACIKGHDVIVHSQRGTGKLTSVLISILQQIDTSLDECQALILAPSKKSALIIQKKVIAFGDFMKAECFVRKTIPNNRLELDTFPHVVVGTPARISDLIIRKYLRTQFIKIFLLVEAKFLLSGDNDIQTKKVFKSLEKDKQVILLSNRMSKNVFDESTHFVSNPTHVLMQKNELILASNLEDMFSVKYFFVNFIKEKCKFDSLCDLFDTLSINQVVIFCNTCYKVEWLTETMRLKTFNVSAMHGEMNRQQNSINMFHFRSGFIRVLITTHFFASTIDVQQVSLVINYDLPSDYENFIHDIERSRYVARKGVVINFISEDENQANETNNYLGPLVTVNSGTNEYDWNVVVDNFHEMNLKEKLLRGIYECGFEKPLAIQQRTILPCIKGHDVTVQAQSGTGKTTSVLIAILQQIDTSLNECQALILAPSRKVALQIQKVVIAFGDFMKADCYACIYGINTLDTFPHVVVGTPACVNDLIIRKCLRTEFIKIFVLDETNKLMNRFTKCQIIQVFKVLKKDVQVIVLSGPMLENVFDVATHFSRNPLRIRMWK